MSKNAKRQLKKWHAEREPPKPPPLVPKKLTVEQRLKSMITGLLGGPRGDPDMHHMLAAAHVVILLETIGKPYKGAKDDDTITTLSGENLYEMNFLELARADAAL